MSNQPNHLINQRSTYLQQHAHNPVDWYPWGVEALQKAQDEQKPLLISIGYATCHWCHVMERESFEDLEVAHYMNSNFVCIKVDREERPDLDNYYMEAVQRIAQNGGWPLNCFALPDGRPFWGGTYYPKDNWLGLLKSIQRVFSTDRQSVEKQAEELDKAFSTPLLQKVAESDSFSDFSVALWPVWRRKLDMEYGGEKGAPKFPMPSTLLALLDLHYHTKEEEIKQYLITTLDQLYRGGIFDQIGGGFARYSTDSSWKVPHFEKMLYDNAQLLEAYSLAYKHFGLEWMRDAALAIAHFLVREMKSADGGFYSAIDADSEGEEGTFYIWEKAEFDSVAGKNADLMATFYGIESEGLWENGKNILLRPLHLADFCESQKIDIEQFKLELSVFNSELLKVRAQRQRPITDTKRVTSWNAMLLKAFAQAYSAFALEWLKEEADSLAFWLQKGPSKDIDVIPHTDTQGEGFLEDYAHLADAFLCMYEVFQKEEDLSFTAQILKETHHGFPMQGQLFCTARSAEARPIKGDLHDMVIPSANSVMHNNLFVFGRLTESKALIEMVDAVLISIADKLRQHPFAYSNWVRLALRAKQTNYIAAVCGQNATSLVKKLNAVYIPDCLIVSSEDEKSKIPHLKDRWVAEKTLIHLCTEHECFLPVESEDEVLKRLLRI